MTTGLTIAVRLESPVATSFRCQRAADSLDIDAAKKAVHSLIIPDVHFGTEYSVGLILGASGSGKTTLAQSIWGKDVFREVLDPARPVIDQFPDDWNYDQCAEALSGIGLTAVPCWIRPAYTLSNGQRARAEAALHLSRFSQQEGLVPVVLDEWTSVVDRTVAKAMSHCLQKYARKAGRQLVVCSCHYDVAEWLNPDWIIDCNREAFIDRRLLPPDERRRTEHLTFHIRACDKRTWKMFSRYHYLSDRLPGGFITTYGLFHGMNQIGFMCYANYTPKKPNEQMIMHGNRRVVHPDYVGLGLGQRFSNVCAADMASKGYRIMSKFSSMPVYRAMSKDPNWHMMRTLRQIGHLSHGPKLNRAGRGMRENVRTWHFQYIGPRMALEHQGGV